MEIHGEQFAAYHSVATYTLQTLDFTVLTSVAVKIGRWVKIILLILFHHTARIGL